ncbi:AAA family ATPase [Desulfobulbus sp. AH-315-M07]|nr:AAA family ATPase [Desulfobulbus sp. AH-315-M07]
MAGGGDLKAAVLANAESYYKHTLNKLKKGKGDHKQACCPFHDDHNPSFSVNTVTWQWRCFAGCGSGDLFHFAGRLEGLDPKSNFPELLDRMATELGIRVLAEVYPYKDETSEVLYEVVRYEPKDFRQRRPNGSGGYIWKLDDVRRVPFRLPELIAADASEIVFIPEGEKDVEALIQLGRVATCNPGGALMWKAIADEAQKVLAKRIVVIITDKDATGRDHAEDVAHHLCGVAASVRVVEMPGDAHDFSKFLDDGGAWEELEAVINAASEFDPAAKWKQPAAAGGKHKEAEPSSTTTEDSTKAKHAVLVQLADVEPRVVQWLWHSMIPLGKITVLDGDPGLAKSLITLDIAARVSTGQPMPDGVAGDLDGPAGVVLLGVEDDLEDTVRPRLDAAGADPAKIASLKAVKDPQRGTGERLPCLLDIDAIEEAITRTDARLLVIDPLMAYLRGDSHRDQEVRQVLEPVAALAARTKTAVLVVRHLNKKPGGSPIYRGGGSIGIVAAARSGLLVAPDPDDSTERRRILVVTKSNLAAEPPALAYSVDAPDGVPVIFWEGAVIMTAGELLAGNRGGQDGGHVLEEAKNFLEETLCNGARKSKEVKAEATGLSISAATLRRARVALGVRLHHVGKPGEKQWWEWELPGDAAEDPPFAP